MTFFASFTCRLISAVKPVKLTKNQTLIFSHDLTLKSSCNSLPDTETGKNRIENIVCLDGSQYFPDFVECGTKLERDESLVGSFSNHVGGTKECVARRGKRAATPERRSPHYLTPSLLPQENVDQCGA